MFDLNTYLVSRQKKINETLADILDDTGNSDRIVSAMKYSVMAGGKRLRPILCIASAESTGGTIDDVLYVACALEMIHTYSLIHDDLPAMDNDHLRRGKPTCHIAFDEATAILAGDALLTLSFELISKTALSETNNTTHASDKVSIWLNIMHIIAKAAGFQGMIEGQMKDIQSENQIRSLEQLEEIHRLKTGALIEASICAGAILGGAKDTQIDNLICYAKNIGLAFQIVDDILNVEGNSEIMGKSAGTDQKYNKATYPSLIGIVESKKRAAEHVKKALQVIDLFDNRSDPLRAIATYIIERQK